jgi:hypothetical protein
MHHCRRTAAAVLVGTLAAAPIVRAANSTAVPSATPAGVTPRFLGFNNGHFRSTSNTAAWVEYSSVNAMRVWASAADYISATEGPTYGDGITTSAQLDAARAAVRASPESNACINVNGINWGRTQTGRNAINLDHVLSQLHQRGMDVLLQTTRSTSFNYVGAGASGNIWGGRWEQWKWYYTVAYYAAKNYDVQRYQMFNEPDHSASGISGDMSQWIDRMKVASDAVHAAIADVNATFGKSLSVDIYAPVAASTTGSLDTWGKAALNSNRTDFQGNPSPHDIFNVYDVHRYNATGPTFAADQRLFDQRIPAYNQSGRNLPVAYTEFNRQNTSSFSSSANSADTPSVYTEYASILTGAMSEDVRAMYAFKFNQTYWTNSSGVDEPMKTGFYYVDDSATASNSNTHDTTGSTKGAEVMRLADKAFKGERPRYAIATGNALNDAAGSFDADARRYYYFSSNRETAAANVTLNLSNWNVSLGQVVTVEEVSANHHGQVSRTFTVPANKTLTFAQTAQSVFLLSIPAGVAQGTVDLPATADASVSNASPSANNGTSAAAFAARDVAGNGDDATYLKFSLATTGQPNVSRALLRLTGQNITTSTPTILHLYGLLNDTWTETGITWSNAPGLAGTTDARLTGVGTDASPLGMLTYDNATNEFAVDVTDFVRRHPDADVSFVLLREPRFAGDADAGRVRLNTREAAGGQPRLSVSLYADPVYNWRRNGSGALSAAANFDVRSAPNAPGAVLNLSAFVTSPQTVTVTVPTTLGSLNFNNFNAYHLAGSAAVTLDNDGSAPSINVHQGSHKISATLAFAAPASLGLASGTSLDITSNSLALDSAFTPPTALRQYLLAGQLRSSTAASDPQSLLGLGYAPASAAALLVRSTYLGDANLDGAITADDYALLDKGFATGGGFWWQGDFTYDGSVNALDYLLIDRSLALQGGPLSPTFLAGRESQFGPAYVRQLLMSVPEPSFAGCLVGTVALFRRARRRV